MRRVSLLFALLAANPTPTMAASPGELCRAAVSAAEREAGLPPSLLSAIAFVESGRTDPVSGRMTPWPWTLNAEGEGRFFESQKEALYAVRELLSRGVRVIDVGCMQVNLSFHPEAFASLEEAFDPASNARYAARFLKGLHRASGDWMTAAGHYHSQTASRADIYRTRILAAWPAGRAAVAPVDPQLRRREDLAQAWIAAVPGAHTLAGDPRRQRDPVALMADAWGRRGGAGR